ncbi:hemin uptake protein HemP [Paucibacter sp. AS339]|uniref:hemin uptake protein HemP n=1 Tax=Paucibacter hankyongi TaxID=3133434 RepID=UPI0030B043CB
MHNSNELSSSPLAAQQATVGGTTHTVPQSPLTRKRIPSQTLLGDAREIEIDHAGQVYRLRVTALGKLILTK